MKIVLFYIYFIDIKILLIFELYEYFIILYLYYNNLKNNDEQIINGKYEYQKLLLHESPIQPNKLSIS